MKALNLLTPTVTGEPTPSSVEEITWKRIQAPSQPGEHALHSLAQTTSQGDRSTFGCRRGNARLA